MRGEHALVLASAAAMAILAPTVALSQFSTEGDDAGIPAPPPAAPPGQAVVDEEIEEPGAPPWGIVPDDPEVGHVAVVNELADTHKDLTGIMEAQAGGDYSTPDYPFVMTYVDEENEELVVMMHVMAALAGIEYEEREIQVALDTEVDIKIIYGVLTPDATQIQIESWKQYYRSNCLPAYKPGYRTACVLYEGHLRENGIDPASLGTPVMPPPTPLSTADPCTQSAQSSACYAYTQYKRRCLPTATEDRCTTFATQITTAGYALPTSSSPPPAPDPEPTPANPAPVPGSGASVFTDGFESGLAAKWVETGEFDWRADRPDEKNIPSRAPSNKVAEADNCDIGCVLTMRSFLNLSSHASATLEFWRYIDNSLDVGDWLKVQVHSNGKWTTAYRWGGGIGDDDTWHRESYSLAGHLTNDFRVRFVAKMDSHTEEVAIDDVTVRGVLRASSDRTAPVVTVPADISRTSPSTAGVAVAFAATARDAVDGSMAPTCTPASGSTFRVGTTTVRCTATDRAGNTGSAAFRVTVRTTDTAPPALSLPSALTRAATSPSGAPVTYTATARDAVDGSIAPTCTPASGSVFSVGTTPVWCLARDSSGNVARGSFRVTVTPFAPTPAPGTAVLTEDFEGGLSLWTESGEPDWRTGRHEESRNPDGTSAGTPGNSVAKADNCDTSCTLTLASPLNLSGYTGATLTFSRFVDASLDAGEYLRVQAHKGGLWHTIYSWTAGSGNDDTWHHESYSLSSYLVSDFKVRFVARMSHSVEDVSVDNVEVRATGTARADTVPPVVTVPGDISRISNTGSGVVVTFKAMARDAVDGSVTPTCTPASGSTFAVGMTSVSCTATDRAGNKSDGAVFTVTVRVRDSAPPEVSVPSDMTHRATSASGAKVKYNASASDNIDGMLMAECDHASNSVFPVGSTLVTCTATDSSGLTGSGMFTITVLPFVDAFPPVVTVPSGVTATASSASGSAVTYSAPATDETDGTLSSTCAPASDSTFAVGVTTVWCRATDSAGNVGRASFPVIVNFEEGFESGLAGWAAAGGGWASEASENGNPPRSASSNMVAQADDCDAKCSLTFGPVDLSGYATATLEFWRYVDASIDDGEYLAAQVPGNLDEDNDGWDTIYNWTARSDTRGAWHMESHSLADHLKRGFQLRFVAMADGADEEVAIDGVSIRGAASVKDKTGPVLTAPKSITVVATSPAGAIVNYSASAHDAVDGEVIPTCSPYNGSMFAVGTSTVTCTATDSSKNRASATITVTVTAQPTDPAPARPTLRGGMHVDRFSDPPTRTDGYEPLSGTANIVVTHGGLPAVVVSSHVANRVDARGAFSQLTMPGSGGDVLIGTTILATTDIISNTKVSSDAALVRVSGTGLATAVDEVQKGGTVITVSRESVADLAGKGAEIVGAKTHSEGSVLHDSVTVKGRVAGANKVLTGQGIATYWSISGDSGAPVIHTASGGKSSLLGIHFGSIKVFTIDSSGQVVHQGGRSSDGTRVGQFGVFSPWESVARDLGISG